MGSGNTGSCSNAMVVQTIGLAFELVGEEIFRSPLRLISAVQSKEFGAAVQRGLLAEAQRLQKQTGTPPDSNTFLLNMAQAAVDSSRESIKKQIQTSSRFRQLERDAKAMTRAIKCQAAGAPVGVWVNKNEKKLIVIGIVALLGAARAVIYDLRKHGGASTTSKVAKAAGDIATADLVVQKVFLVRKLFGTIELLKQGNTILNFKPSDGKVTLDVKDRSSWYQVNAGLEIAGIYSPHDSLSLSANAGAELKLSKVDRAKAESTFSYKPNAQNASPVEWSLSLGLNRALGHGASLDLTASLKSPSTPSARVPNASGMVVLSIPF